MGSEEKAALAQEHGARARINYSKENVVAKVKRAHQGRKGVPVVYDGVGKDTWEGSLDCLQPRGLMVSFGNASGAVPAWRSASSRPRVRCSSRVRRSAPTWRRAGA